MLYLDTTPVSGDVKGLARLTELQKLNLRNTQVSGDVKGLAPLTELQGLGLARTHVDTCQLAVLDLAKLVASPTAVYWDVPGTWAVFAWLSTSPGRIEAPFEALSREQQGEVTTKMRGTDSSFLPMLWSGYGPNAAFQASWDDLADAARKWSTYIIYHGNAAFDHSTPFGKIMVESELPDKCTWKQDAEEKSVEKQMWNALSARFVRRLFAFHPPSHQTPFRHAKKSQPSKPN